VNRPETDTPALEGDADSVYSAASWGEKEEARQVALLDAVVRLDNIHNVIDKMTASEESGEPIECSEAPRTLPLNIEDELRQSYLDYAMSVIVGKALDPEKAAGKLRVISRKVLSWTECGLIGGCDLSRHTPSLREIQKQALTAALAIIRLKQAAKNGRISSLLLKLINSAKAAHCRLPLFAYGPELSEYRHRLR